MDAQLHLNQEASQPLDEASMPATDVQGGKKRSNGSVQNLINTYVSNLMDLGLGDFRNVKSALASRVCVDSSGTPIMVRVIVLLHT